MAMQKSCKIAWLSSTEIRNQRRNAESAAGWANVSEGPVAATHFWCQKLSAVSPRSMWWESAPKRAGIMRMPGVEPGSQAWEACMMPLHYVRCCIFCSCLLLLKFCVGPSIAKGSLSKYALTCARGNFTKDSLRTSAPCPCLFLQEKPKGSKM